MSSGSPVAAVVAVGDELLYGTTIETNGAWLGSRLADAGLPVVERRVVGDVESEIGAAVSDCLARAQLVVVTGGLGPTPDDRTREAVAAALGLELRTDADLVRTLEERFRSYGYTRLPQDNLSQAAVPVGADVLHNPLGSAPGLCIPTPSGGKVILVPGVPREMRGLITDQVLPRLDTWFPGALSPVHHLWIRTTGIAESVLSQRVEEILTEGVHGVSLAFLPRLTGVDLRLGARPTNGMDAPQKRLAAVAEILEPVVGAYRYEAPETGDLVEAVHARLRASGQTVSVAESCTGGLVAMRITALPGASMVFDGGVIAYANAAKREALGVDPDVLLQHGAVSEEVAKQMAAGVRDRFDADWGIALTGVAGPGGGSEEKPVGTVWTGLAGPGGDVRAAHRRFPGDRDGVRIRSAQAALAWLHRELAQP